MRPRIVASSIEKSARGPREQTPAQIVRTVTATAVCGLAITCLFFVYLRDGERKYFDSQVQRSAEAGSELIKDRLESSRLMVVAIGRFLESQEKVTPDSFFAFAAPLVGHCPEAKTVEWIPAVPDRERTAFESNWRGSADPKFRIYERDQNGKDRIARQRTVYYPVLFAVPLKTNEKAIGFDLGSSPARLAALERARDTGHSAVTERIKLVQEDGTHFGLLLASPVYRQGAATETVEERRSALRGFALAVFDADEIQAFTIGRLAPIGLDSRLLDLSAPQESSELSFRRSDLRVANSWKRLLSPDAPARSLDRFPYGGREWGIEFVATDAYVERNYNVLFWLVLPAGILVTAIVSRSVLAVLLQRQRLESAVAEQTASLRLQTAALKAAANAIVITDSAGKIQWVNPAFTQLTGYAEEEVQGQNPRLLKSGSQDLRFYQTLWHTILSGGVWQGEVINRRKDGSLYTEEMTITPVASTPGQTSHYIAIKRDISARKLAEKALQRAEEQYRTIFDEAIIGIFRSTPDGRVLMVNPAMAKMLRYDSPDQAIQRADLSFLFGDLAKRPELTTRLEANGELRDVEQELRRHDGTELWLSLNLRCFYNDDRTPAYYEGTAADITERKLLEQQLRQAQKMEAVGRLAGGVAHDFNNMLGVINGYSELLKMRADLDKTAVHQIEEIHVAGKRAAVLTQQLLAFSRKQIAQRRIVNLNDVISKLSNMLLRLIGEDIELTFHFSTSDARVSVDEGQIDQVIMNLAVNARDAMPNGGKLMIETYICELDEFYAMRHTPVRPGRYVKLTVTDTGCGMDPDTMSHLFEPFFTTKELGRGTGLGLSIVYGIIKQSGGYVWADSKSGQGTSFKIYLPLQCADVERTTAPSPIENVIGSESVLVVEDNQELRSMVVGFLRGLGYSVLEAEDGERALEIAKTAGSPVQVLITDIVMPKMGGRELADQLISESPKIRVIYTSGYTHDSAVQTRVLREGEAFLQKPFALSDLIKTLRDVIGKGQPDGEPSKVVRAAAAPR